DTATGVLALYWGESKLHGDVNSAVRECFKSIAPFLTESGSSSAPNHRDLHLLRDNLDLKTDELNGALGRYLDPNDVLHKKVQFRGACLIGYDHGAYPKVSNTKLEDEVKAEIESGLQAHWARVKRNVVKEKLETFSLEVFCLPFPDVE